LGIFGTSHTFIAIIAFDTDRQGTVAPAVAADLAGLAGTLDAIGCGLIGTIAVAQAAHALHTTGTEGCVPTAARVVRHIAESTAAVDALSGRRVITISVPDALRTLGTIVDAEGCLLSTARVIGWVTDRADRVHTLLAITVAVGTTGDARAAVGGTEGCVTDATGVIAWIAGDAGVVNTLAGTGVSAIEVGATANAAQDAVIIITDGRIALAALVRA